MTEIQLGNTTIELSNLDKVFFPDAGLTKKDLIDYYRRIADQMLPYLKDRPLSLHRFPDGIQKDGFIQQQAPEYFPDWIERITVEKEEGTITHVVCRDEATLVYLANQGVITPHVWLSRTDRLHHPDRMIFDLDPPDSDDEESGFKRVCRAAQALKKLLNELEITAFVMTTGSSGLHVVAPIERSADFDTVRSFARSTADLLVSRHTEELTTEQRKNKRGGRIFLDTLRNAYGQTAVSPYAVRALPAAPVATPLDWKELDYNDLNARRYTIRNLFRRFGQKNPSWKAIEEQRCSLPNAQKRLAQLREENDTTP